MKIKKILLVVCLLFMSFATQAQIYNYYQIFIYNFAKYIEWPTDKQSGDFVIGVLGNSPLVEHLNKMASQKKVGDQTIKVIVFQSVNDVKPCHMLFLPEGKSNSFASLKGKLGGSPTLLITEKEGLGKQGSNINFIVVNGKLRFELNKVATEKSNLKVSSDLTKLAILI